MMRSSILKSFVGSSTWATVLLIAAAVSTSCAGDPQQQAPGRCAGEESCACFEDQSCAEGLECQNDRCRAPQDDGADGEGESSNGTATGEPSPDGAEPSPDGAEPSPDGAEPSPDGAEPSPDGAEPSPDGAEPSPDGAEPSPDGAEPSPDGAEPSPDGAEPSPDGSGGANADPLEPEPANAECNLGESRCAGSIELQRCGADGFWGNVELCPYACDQGECQGSCVPGARRCDAMMPQECTPAGDWINDGAACAESCVDGRCSGECEPGVPECVSATEVADCSGNGTFEPAVECEFVCQDGYCEGECRPGEVACSEGVAIVRECASTGYWNFSQCPYVCSDGACTGECVPGAAECVSSTELRSCDENGLWAPAEFCPAACSSNQCSGSCVPNSRACASETEWHECDATGNFGPAVDCGSLCVGDGECSACSPGDVACANDTPSVCDEDGLWQVQPTCAGTTSECNTGVCRVPAEWARLVAGSSYTCGLRSDGTLWCWGRGDFGVLGNGSLADAVVPTQVRADEGEVPWSDWIDVAAGDVSCGFRSPGGLWCWGTSYWGLGVGADVGTSQPLRIVAAGQVLGGSYWEDWVSVTSGGGHTCGLRADGSAWCWGDGGVGQRGDGSSESQRLSPVQVLAAGESEGGAAWSDWVQLAAGSKYTCGIRSDSTLWCWGSGGAGVRGDGTTTNTRTTPVQVLAAGESAGGASWSDWSYVAASREFTCGLRQNGTIWCWGLGQHGELGSGALANTTTPVQVIAESEPAGGAAWSDWVSFSLGAYTACGLRANGSLWCWGNGQRGLRGDGTTASTRSTPVQVLARNGGSGWTDWQSVSMGPAHGCGLRAGGEAWCWGRSDDGQRGDGTTEDGTTPTRVLSP